MPDPRFFKNKGPFLLQEIARLTAAELRHPDQGDKAIKDVAPLDQAGPENLSFFDNARYKDQFCKTKAGACIVDPSMVEHAPSGVSLLLSDSPYKSYALAAQAFYGLEEKPSEISKNAFIHAEAELGKNIRIEPGAVIEAGVSVGDNSWIESGAIIKENVELGQNCRIGANAVISHALIGDYVRVYPGACVGQDGFGFAIDPAGHVKVPQLGRVLIEDHVEIGSNTTIDRGAGPDTVIRQGTWIDNLVQIAHNVKIGKGCVIVAQVGISGSCVIEDYAVLAGQVGMAGHLRVGKGAKLAAQSGVMRDVPPGEEHMGSPAQPIKQYLREIATLRRLSSGKK